MVNITQKILSSFIEDNYMNHKLLFFGIILFIALVVSKHVFHDPSTRICSWNIRFFGITNQDHDSNKLYCQYVSNYIKQIDPDILCLQEVSSYSSLQQLNSLLQEYEVYVSKETVDKNKKMIEKHGIKQLNTFIGDKTKDIGDVQFNVFLVKKHLHVSEFRSLHPKMICLKYKDKQTGQFNNVYNCHFPSNYSGNKSGGRQKAILKLLRDIKRHDVKNVIISGDLNTERKNGELTPLINNFVDVFDHDHIQSRHLGVQPVYTHCWDKNKNGVFDSGDKYSQIDYFFVSPRLVNRVWNVYVDTTFCGENMGTLLHDLSDHCAIVMDMV